MILDIVYLKVLKVSVLNVPIVFHVFIILTAKATWHTDVESGPDVACIGPCICSEGIYGPDFECTDDECLSDKMDKCIVQYESMHSCCGDQIYGK